MPRKPKTSVEKNPADNSVSHSANGKANGAEAKKKTRASGAPPKKKKPLVAKKGSDKKTPETVSKTPAEPTDEQIRLRAYFLAERRHRLALPGDSNHDWIEARRQLIEEARQQ